MNQNERAQIVEAFAELSAALIQAIPSDDEIIIGHVKNAQFTLRRLLYGTREATLAKA
jgi:hypothetical protein